MLSHEAASPVSLRFISATNPSAVCWLLCVFYLAASSVSRTFTASVYSGHTRFLSRQQRKARFHFGTQRRMRQSHSIRHPASRSCILYQVAPSLTIRIPRGHSIESRYHIQTILFSNKVLLHFGYGYPRPGSTS